MGKRKISRISAAVCALALTVSALNFEPLVSYLKPAIVAHAVGESDGTSGNTGNGGGVSTLDNGYGLVGDCVGYRIYLAPNNVWLQATADGTKNVGVTENSVDHLSDYHKMALYELSCVDGSSSYSCACRVNNHTDTDFTEFYIKDTKTAEGETVKSLAQRTVGVNRILSKGAGANQSPDFAQLFKGITTNELPQTKTLTTWGTTLAAGSDTLTWDFTNLSDWANERFMNLGDHQAAVNKMLVNYKGIVGDTAWQSAQYPNNYNEFAGKWCFVVEPIIIIGNMSGEKRDYAVSYQDYLSLELGDPIDNGHSVGNLGVDMTRFDIALGGTSSKNSSNKMYMYSKNTNSYVYRFAKSGMNRFAMMSFFYADFDFTADTQTKSVNTAPKIPSNYSTAGDQLKYVSGHLKESASTAGFAVYTDFEGAWMGGQKVLAGNQNYWVVPSKDYEYKNVLEREDDNIYNAFEFQTGDGQLGNNKVPTYVGGTVYNSDLLTTEADLDKIANQALNTENEFKLASGGEGTTPAASGLSMFAHVTNWGNSTWSQMYPSIKGFNYKKGTSVWNITSANENSATAFRTGDSFNVSSSKVVAGDSQSANTFSKDNGYYLKTFYAYEYKYTVSKANVTPSILQRGAKDGVFSFYVYPNAALTAVSDDDTRVFYAGSKFSTGMIDNYVASVSGELSGKSSTDATGIKFNSANVLVSAPKYKLMCGTGSVDGKYCGVNSKTAWGFANEMSMYALANSNIVVKPNAKKPVTLKTSTSKSDDSVTATVEILCKDTKVDSYISYGGKDNNGNIYSGKYATLDEVGNATFTDKPVTKYNYSVVDVLSAVNDENVNDVITIENKSQNNKPVYLIAIPNSEKYSADDTVGAFGYDLSKVDESKFYNDFFSTLENRIGSSSINNVVGLNRIAIALGEMDIRKDYCVIKLVTASTVEEEATKIALGAYGGCRGEATPLSGYSIYVIEDFEAGEPIDCEGTLRAYELNYVYPTILCETDADLVPFYVADGDTVNISKTDDYKGALITYNAANKITLLDMLGTKLEFDNEQTDPKTFTYDLMQYKNIVQENVGYKRGYSYLTHAVNLTRGCFNDAPVVSSLSQRDASLTADYLKQLGVTAGNTGRDTTGTAEEYLLGTNYDTFRWSSNRGLPVMFNGQLVEVTPFGDGQPMNSAGYNLTTKGYAYIPTDREVGESVSTGTIDGSLVVPDKGQLTYKSLTVEEYDTVLKFYPEYKMITYVFDEEISDGEASNEPAQAFTYMMADKIRRVKAAGLYSLSIGTASNPVSGTTISDTVATGSAAKALSQRLGGLKVIYAGGNINLSANTNFGIDLSGFVLDQIDKSEDTGDLIGRQGTVVYTDIIADNSYIKQTWGNDLYDAVTEYSNWVSEVKNALAAETSLVTYNGSRIVKQYNGFTTNVGAISGGDITGVTTYVLSFRNGAVVKDNAYNAMIKALAIQQYGNESPTDAQIAEAERLFAKSDIFTSIVSSIESRGDEDNASEEVGMFNGKWYDEEVRSFVIRQFHTAPLKVENILVSDKIDITAGPTQTGNTAADLFSNGYVAKWGLTIYLKSALSTNSEMIAYSPSRGNFNDALNSGSVLAHNIPITGADFIVSDATTADTSN